MKYYHNFKKIVYLFGFLMYFLPAIICTKKQNRLTWLIWALRWAVIINKLYIIHLRTSVTLIYIYLIVHGSPAHLVRQNCGQIVPYLDYESNSTWPTWTVAQPCTAVKMYKNWLRTSGSLMDTLNSPVYLYITHQHICILSITLYITLLRI